MAIHLESWIAAVASAPSQWQTEGSWHAKLAPIGRSLRSDLGARNGVGPKKTDPTRGHRSNGGQGETRSNPDPKLAMTLRCHGGFNSCEWCDAKKDASCPISQTTSPLRMLPNKAVARRSSYADALMPINFLSNVNIPPTRRKNERKAGLIIIGLSIYKVDRKTMI